MTARYLQQSGTAIVHDPVLAPEAETALFEPARWQQLGAISRTATGRAEVHFIDTGAAHWVLRHYRRGGLIGRLVHDQYVWTGLTRTRAWREWHLLAELHARGFPVPPAVAARVQRSGLFYRADLITALIADAEPLADTLAREALPAAAWTRLGQTIARFHQAGIHHSDLNARNILWRASEGRFFLLDFDGARRDASPALLASGVARLRRSLDKFVRLAAEKSASFHFNEAGWQALLAGYRSGA
jgi:3-deoxy-D-manno-octulosonic acid kinase